MMSSSISFPVSIILLFHLIISVSAAYPGNSYKHEEVTLEAEKYSGGEDDMPTLPDIHLPLNNYLSRYYYSNTCPDVEKIIYTKVKEWYDKDNSIAPSLLRLHFHDCAVRGCDASILLNHEGSERMANASKTLGGFEVIDDIKKEIEKECPRTVSCADILTAATRDATRMVNGGTYWTVEYGRKDGMYSYAKEADELVPTGYESITTLLQLFQSMGLDVSDLVILSGAHTIGRSSCGAIQDRIYNFNGYGKPDESIDKKYLNYLQRKCRWSSEYVALDATTPNTFDTDYYQNLEKNMGLLSTDQLLYSDSRTKPIASALANGITSDIYTQLFGASITKLGKVGVLTGNDEGEIRTNCSIANSHKY